MEITFDNFFFTNTNSNYKYCGCSYWQEAGKRHRDEQTITAAEAGSDNRQAHSATHVSSMDGLIKNRKTGSFCKQGNYQ